MPRGYYNRYRCQEEAIWRFLQTNSNSIKSSGKLALFESRKPKILFVLEFQYFQDFKLRVPEGHLNS